MTRRAMPAVALLPVGPPKPDRSKGRCQTKRNTLVLQVGGCAQGWFPCHVKNTITHKPQGNKNRSGNKGNGRNGNGRDFGISEILKIGTWNVRGLRGKEVELERELHEKAVNIAIISETKKKLQGTQDIKNYTLIYKGVDQHQRASAGIGIMIDKRWKRKILSYSFVNERILTVRFNIDRGKLLVIGVYAPTEGNLLETEQFYEQLQDLIDHCNKNDFVIICGDLNARVGKQPIPQVIGTEGEDFLNENGKTLREFVTFNDLKITNTFFKKKEIHKYTWCARGYRTLIDYIITNRKIAPLVKDVHVYRGSDVGSDHFLTCAKIGLWTKWRKSTGKIPNHKQNMTYKIHLLAEESIQRLYQERLKILIKDKEITNDVNIEWKTLRTCIEKAASEALGTKNKRKSRRGLRIWTEEIANAVKEKHRKYQIHLQQNTETSKRAYAASRNIVKALIKKTQGIFWERYISNLEYDLHGSQFTAYKSLRFLNSTERDTAEINVIKEREWIEHYKNLWFDEHKIYNNVEDPRKDCDEVDPIEAMELKEALIAGKNRKAPGADRINMELFKYADSNIKLRLLHLINLCWKQGIIPDEWKTAKVISLFKKGDRSNCNNYRGISLMNTGYRIYSRIISNRLRPIAHVLLLEEQNGFRKGRSCIDSVFSLKQIFEKRREFNLETHVAFIDFEKAFDKVDREKLWEIMERRGYPHHLIKAIKSLYKETFIVLDMGYKISEKITINQGVRQGCSLSPHLFNIYIDHIIRLWKCRTKTGIQLGNLLFNNILFADDLCLLQDEEDKLQRALFTLYTIGHEYNLKISKEKTKVMAFRGKYPIRTKIIIENQPIEQLSHFKYLGCDMSYDYDEDLKNKLARFQYICGTIKRTLRNTRKETRMKFFRTMAVPILLYGSETWTLRKEDERAIQTSEMRFLRSVKGCKLIDKIRNEDIRQELRSKRLLDIVTEYRIRWKEHVERMDDERTPKAALNYRPKGKRDRGRPRKRWIEAGTGQNLNP